MGHHGTEMKEHLGILYQGRRPGRRRPGRGLVVGHLLVVLNQQVHEVS